MRLLSTLVLSFALQGSTAAGPSDTVPVAFDSADVKLLSNIGTAQEELAARVDSLSGVVLRHDIGTEFFDSALDEQVNRFALIVGALLALVGLLGYGGFRYEVDRVRRETREEIARYEKKHEDIENKMNNAMMRMALIHGNTLRLISDISVTQGRLGPAFEYALGSAASHHERYRMNTQKNQKSLTVANANLKTAKKLLARLDLSGRDGSYLQKNVNGLKRSLDELGRSENEETIQETAAMRIQLRKYLMDDEVDKGKVSGA
jgi:hypothetical protein